MGPLYPREREEAVRSNEKVNTSSAPNVFQWNVLDGLSHWVKDSLEVVNVLPVGTWPGGYRRLFLRDGDWTSGGIRGHELGCINLPFLKQYIRGRKAERLLRQRAGADSEVVIYSAYMPFLRAAYRLPPAVKVTAIITDLPEYYDLGQTSFVRKWFRSWQNRMIYRYLKRVDRFVLLTDQMAAPLQVGQRPWMRMEGICRSERPPEGAAAPGGVKGILYTGTLHYQYGITNLLEAFEAIKDPLAELWICGSGEGDRAVIELAGRDRRVRFFGFCSQQEVAQLREKAAILVNPRTNDGEYTRYSFPSKTMEYMASGKPVVMYRLDGIPDEYAPFLFYVEEGADAVRGLKGALEQVLEDYGPALCRAKAAQDFVLGEKNFLQQTRRMVNFICENG